MKTILTKSLLMSGLLLTAGGALAHGLMTNPPARNAVCGLAEDQKPHNATLPACQDAFATNRDSGYQFMSVLTHDVGRKGVSPLPNNVCGFDSETWDSFNNGNVTPWDIATDWPTQSISAGPLDITWDIQWGPHFDDTEEFVYYITKPGFNFQVGTPLSWSDFESEPFCDLRYDDSNPTANPNVVSNKGASTFTTRCNVPAREGRHVIYGEWGRNFFTFERFHGCIDVSFGSGGPGGPVPTPTPLPTFTPPPTPVPSTPTPAPTPGPGPEPNEAPTASFSTSVSGLSVTLDASASFDPDNGPNPLSFSWNFGDGSQANGASVAHTYATSGNYNVQLTVSDGEASDSTSRSVSVSDGGGSGGVACRYVISNSWNAGFVAEIHLTNNGSAPVSGWEVSWDYSDNSEITHFWSSNIEGTGPYVATPLPWNTDIAPGQTINFGFQGSHSGATQVPSVNGTVCSE